MDLNWTTVMAGWGERSLTPWEYLIRCCVAAGTDEEGIGASV